MVRWVLCLDLHGQLGSVLRYAWSGGLGAEVCMVRWVLYLGLHGQVGSVLRSAWSGGFCT